MSDLTKQELISAPEAIEVPALTPPEDKRGNIISASEIQDLYQATNQQLAAVVEAVNTQVASLISAANTQLRNVIDAITGGAGFDNQLMQMTVMEITGGADGSPENTVVDYIVDQIGIESAVSGLSWSDDDDEHHYLELTQALSDKLSRVSTMGWVNNSEPSGPQLQMAGSALQMVSGEQGAPSQISIGYEEVGLLTLIHFPAVHDWMEASGDNDGVAPPTMAMSAPSQE